MFKLRSSLHKYSRGIKLLAEKTYVSIGDYVWTANNDETTKTIEATITIRGEKETYYLSIPDDKLDSVIKRLQEIQEKRQRQLNRYDLADKKVS